MTHDNGRSDGRTSVRLDEWTDLLAAFKGRYAMTCIGSNAFAGTVRCQSVCGLEAVDIACSVPEFQYGCRADRTQSDIRVDGRENFYALFQVAGRSAMEQDDQCVDLDAGAIALVDSALPVSIAVGSDECRWLSLVLPRRSVISTLGAEPRRRACGETAKSLQNLLFRLAVDELGDREPHAAETEPYLRLAILDLVGALFVASDVPAITPHSDKIFARVCGIMQDGFANPDLSPARVADEAGISLRYLQKLFTVRGTTFCRRLYAFRLEHAARLLRHRASLKTGQPLSMIAYASGFRDYSHFARAYRGRFGHLPGRD